jgi:FLVCR family MFS transporter
MEQNSDTLLPSPPPPPLSALLERLWVVSMFSIFAFMQGLCWAIPGPISSAYSTLYGADAWMVQLYVNLGPIVYLPLSLPFALWLDKPGGVKHNALLGVTLVTSGQVARMLASGASPSSTALLTLSFVLNAAAGPIAMGAVGKISEAFFPPAQRATATAVMAEANLLGMAGAMLFGPLIVRDSTAAQMAAYNYALLAVCLVAQAGITLYFPAHPRVPPSASAVLLERKEAAMSLRLLWDALLKLGMNPTFCVLSLTYGFATGMFGSWATVLSINLSGCSSLWVGWLSFSMTVCGGFGGIVMGRVADVFRQLKRTLVVLLALSSLAFLAFAALVAEDPGAVCKADGSPAVGMVGLFVLGSFGGLFLNSTIPLFYEMVLETSFPLPEATVVRTGAGPAPRTYRAQGRHATRGM